MAEKAKRRRRPGRLRRRKMPADADSLEKLIRSLHAQLRNRLEHLREHPHTIPTRSPVPRLLKERAEALKTLFTLNPATAKAVADDLGLRFVETLITEESDGR